MDENPPEILRFAGDQLTMPELAQAISSATDNKLDAVNKGSVKDLADLIASKKSTSGNPWDWIALQYHHNMVSGRAKFDNIDNDRYDVKPETVAEFAERTRS